MGVALENARLFDETQRLFKESEQRAAELAIINSVQQALAAELNMQGIYDAVGDKIREIFHQADIGIRIYDAQTNLIHYPYVYEDGQRISIASTELRGAGFAAHVLRTRETVVINENIDEESQKYGSFTLPGTQDEKSVVFVPLVAGEQARGVISLADLEREHAFSPSDVRLLQTLANAMSVALENARLFDETQRLFKESEQRAAELAIINSVQHALAAELNMQGIYDAVGDKIREIFHHADVGIRIYDPQTGLVHYPYTYENGQRIGVESEPLGETGFAVHVLRTREPLVINENMAQESAALRQLHAARHADGKIGGAGAAGGRRPGTRDDQHCRHGARARVQPLRRAPAADAGQQHERGAGKRPPVRRNAAPHAGDRSAGGGRSRHLLDARPGHRARSHRPSRQGPAQRREQRDLPARSRRAQLPGDRRGRRHREGNPVHRDQSRGGHHRQPGAKRARRVHQ